MLHHLFSKKTGADPERAYLDWASAAPVHPASYRAFQEALVVFGNPSSPHGEGRKANEVLEAARSSIAWLAGVKQRAVVFTSGATESNNLAIRGRIKRLHDEGMPYERMHVLYLPTMHASLQGSIEKLAKLGVETEPIALAGFAIDFSAFEKQLRPETVLVCADAVCGETGARFDTLRLRRIIDVARSNSRMKEPPLLHVDASQLPLVEPIERTRLGADLLALDAQKVGGIRGIGALIVPDVRSLAPILAGGDQEEGLRPGTEAVALAAAFAAALEARAQECEMFAARAREARSSLVARIAETVPQAIVNEGSRQAPHILNISLPKCDTDYAVMLLDAAGFAVSTKSACETDSEHGSRAILAYTRDEGRSKATLRISWGPETEAGELSRFAEELARTASFLAG